MSVVSQRTAPQANSLILRCGFMPVCDLPTYLPTCLPTYLTTYLPTYLSTYLHACMHACMHAYIHMYVCVYIYIHIYDICMQFRLRCFIGFGKSVEMSINSEPRSR